MKLNFNDDSPPVADRVIPIMFVCIALFAVADIIVDLQQGVDGLHILLEALIVPMAAIGLYFVWDHVRALGHTNVGLKADLVTASAEARRWKGEVERSIEDIAQSIERQFERWGLSAAEAEVARLLLKGLGLKEIATLRETSERTTRQQALAVYSKAGLSSRAELAAFFLEDILVGSKAN